ASTITVTAAAKGFACKTIDINPHEASDLPLLLTLEHGGSLRVTCIQKGQLLSRYRLTWWSATSPESHNLIVLDDPRFVLDGVPIGDVSLVASVPGQSQSSTTRTTVLADSSNSVEL